LIAETIHKEKLKTETLKRVYSLFLQNFTLRVTPHYTRPLHLKPLLDKLNLISFKNKPTRLIVSVPPRHGKTELILHFIAQYLYLNPSKTVAYVSYAQQQSESKIIKAQRYCIAAGLEPDKNLKNRSEYRLKKYDGYNEQGGILCTGIGGPLTGQGFDVGIIDDPIKNREEADSLLIREKHWDWFTDVFETRLEPNASIILVLTRWHEDDLAGRILKHRKDEYDYIRIPALADGMNNHGTREAPDLLGRAIGEPLWPERYSKEDFDKVKEQQPFTFTAMFQGLPLSRMNRLITGAHYYNELPKEDFEYFVGCDLAYTKKDYSNFSVCVVLAKHENKKYVIEVHRWKEGIEATRQRLKAIQAKYPVAINLEANGPQIAICDMIESDGIMIERCQPIGDKLARSQAMAEDWEAGNILLPAPINFPNVWLNPFLSVLQEFTGVNDRYDDDVDALVMAVNAANLGTEYFKF